MLLNREIRRGARPASGERFVDQVLHVVAAGARAREKDARPRSLRASNSGARCQSEAATMSAVERRRRRTTAPAPLVGDDRDCGRLAQPSEVEPNRFHGRLSALSASLSCVSSCARTIAGTATQTASTRRAIALAAQANRRIQRLPACRTADSEAENIIAALRLVLERRRPILYRCARVHDPHRILDVALSARVGAHFGGRGLLVHVVMTKRHPYARLRLRTTASRYRDDLTILAKSVA